MPTKVVNIPYGKMNPYQDMMYSACEPEIDLNPVQTVDFDQYARPEFQAENGVIHIHWDDRLFRDVSGDIDHSDPLFSKARDSLKIFRQNGGRIIWTIHNQIAHSHRGTSDRFIENRRQLADLVDLIHVHTPHAKSHVIEEYQADPDKIRLIPHPSYLGVYESVQSTLQRAMEPRNATRFLTFGAMRGNRELDRLQTAAKKLTNRGREFHLSVVGRAPRASQRLIRRMQTNPNITVVSSRIPDEEIPSVFSQAHVYVLPSTTTFTSGTAMLAQSFGLPIIAPDIEPHRQTTPESCHDLLYSAQNPRGLIRMMMRVMEMSDDELDEKRRACFEFALERDPAHISRELKHVLLEMQ